MMPAVLDYILKLSICLAVVYLFYQLLLRRLTFYNWNRWYLLGYSALSFIIPVIDVMPQLQKREMDSTTLLQWIPVVGAPEVEKTFFETLSYQDWALILMVAGTLFFLLRFLIKLISFWLISKKATLISSEQIRLYQLNEDIIPFSFGHAIYINRHLHSEAELQEIIRHEFVHVKQNHTLDIIFCELLCVFNWFNPFTWLIRHSVKQNLEFIADNKVVQNGFDKKEYQYLLLKVMGNKQFAFTNHFNFSNLKKRIKMMNTLKTAKVHLIKFLFLLPVVAVLLLSFRKEMHKIEVKASPNFVRDTVPDADSGYKISVITTPGAFDNNKMQRTVIDRMSLEDWNKNKEFYEKKYGQGVPIKPFVHTKDGKTVKYDSVYVTKYKPKPIAENILFIIDGKESSKTEMAKMHPNDIESISVLKDTSATRMYGAKGKNGVIIIATKKGLKGSFEKDNMIHEFSADSVIFNDKGPIILMGKPSGKITPRNKKQQPGFTDSLKGKTSKVIVKGYAMPKNERESAQNTNVAEREKPLLIIDGKEMSEDEFKKIKPESINELVISKDKNATEKYGDKGKNGVIEIKLKESAKEK